MRKMFLLRGVLIALLAFSLSGLVVSAAEMGKSGETISADIPRLEDYADQNYMLSVYYDLERRIPKEVDFAKQWAVAKFVVDRKGNVEKAEIENSTGDQKFNVEVLKILHETRLPPLPEDCPDRVRATHAFNYRRAVKGSPNTKAAAADTNKSEEVKQLFNKFGSGQSDGSTTDANAVSAKNAMTNSLLLCYGVFIVMFLGGGSIFAFFIALPIWYLHRLFFGRFPA